LLLTCAKRITILRSIHANKTAVETDPSRRRPQNSGLERSRDQDRGLEEYISCDCDPRTEPRLDQESYHTQHLGERSFRSIVVLTNAQTYTGGRSHYPDH